MGTTPVVSSSKVSGVGGQVDRVKRSAVGERLGVRDGRIILVIKLGLGLELDVAVASVGELFRVVFVESFLGRRRGLRMVVVCKERRLGNSKASSLRGEMFLVPGVDAFLIGLNTLGFIEDACESVSGRSWRVLQGSVTRKASGILGCVDGRVGEGVGVGD